MVTVVSNKILECVLGDYAKETYGNEWQKVEVQICMENRSRYNNWDGEYGYYLTMCARINLQKKKIIKLF